MGRKAGVWNLQNSLLARGQVNGHNILVQKQNFTCPKEDSDQLASEESEGAS